MTKAEILAKIAANTEGTLVEARAVKEYPSGRQLWSAGVTLTTADPDTLNNATQEFYWDPETDSAKWAGAIRKNYEAPADPVPEVSAFKRAKTALDAAFPGTWKYIKHVTDSNGTLVTIKVSGIKKVVTLQADGSVLDADAE